MPLIQLIVLAIVQGITEFLPISSSAHLIMTPLFVDGWSDQGPLIDVSAHVGSLVAVLVYFKHETAMLFRGGVDTLRFKESEDRKLFLFIAAATIPTLLMAGVVVGLDLMTYLRSPYVIGVTSIVFGLLLWHGDRAPAAKEGLDRITWRDAMTIGLLQAVSLVPGVSRSGITMTAARYLGWKRPEAARFSMLLAIPTIMALGFFAIIEIATEGPGAGATATQALIVAALSFVSAYAGIVLLMRLTKSIDFTPFVIYRLVMGVVLLAYAGRLAGA